MAELVSRDGVIRLINRYAQRIDARDADGVAACFVDHAVLSFNGGAVVHEGIEAIGRVYAEALGDGPGSNGTSTTHLTSNIVVDVSDDGQTAEATVKVVAFLQRDDVIRVRGLQFDDIAVRTAEGWRFRGRRHRVHWQSEIPATAVSVPAFGLGR